MNRTYQYNAYNNNPFSPSRIREKYIPFPKKISFKDCNINIDNILNNMKCEILSELNSSLSLIYKTVENKIDVYN